MSVMSVGKPSVITATSLGTSESTLLPNCTDSIDTQAPKLGHLESTVFQVAYFCSYHAGVFFCFEMSSLSADQMLVSHGWITVGMDNCSLLIPHPLVHF